MTLRTTISALAGVIAIGATAFGAARLVEMPPPSQDPVSATLATTGTTGTVETAGDVSGPCDEPEHRTDPRCTGVPTTTAAREPGEDVRGPCDEAENRNDPRCTGAAPQDDRSGPGDGGSREGAEDDRSGPSGDDGGGDSRSGSNSGPG